MYSRDNKKTTAKKSQGVPDSSRVLALSRTSLKDTCEKKVSKIEELFAYTNS